jgi:hypothetical protein
VLPKVLPDVKRAKEMNSDAPNGGNHMPAGSLSSAVFTDSVNFLDITIEVID